MAFRAALAAGTDKVTTDQQAVRSLALQRFRRALFNRPETPPPYNIAALRLFGELNWDIICEANPGIPADAAVTVLLLMWEALPMAGHSKFQAKAATPAGRKQLQWRGFPRDYAHYAASSGLQVKPATTPATSKAKGAAQDFFPGDTVPEAARPTDTTGLHGLANVRAAPERSGTGAVVPSTAASANAPAGPHGPAGARAAAPKESGTGTTAVPGKAASSNESAGPSVPAGARAAKEESVTGATAVLVKAAASNTSAGPAGARAAKEESVTGCPTQCAQGMGPA